MPISWARTDIRRTTDGDGQALADHVVAWQGARRARATRPGAPVELGDDRRIRILGECAHEAQRRGVAGRLVVVPQEPAHDLAPFIAVLRTEFPQRLDNVVEDHARLRQSHAPMFQHRCLAHDIDVAIRGRACFPAEIIDATRSPVGAGHFERQRHLVAVARLRKAKERVLGRNIRRHVTSLPSPASVRLVQPIHPPMVRHRRRRTASRRRPSQPLLHWRASASDRRIVDRRRAAAASAAGRRDSNGHLGIEMSRSSTKKVGRARARSGRNRRVALLSP